MLDALMFSPSVLVAQEALTTLQGHPILLRSILTNYKDYLTLLLIGKYNGGTYNIILTVALSSELMDGLRHAVSPRESFMKDSGKKGYLCSNDAFN